MGTHFETAKSTCRTLAERLLKDDLKKVEELVLKASIKKGWQQKRDFVITCNVVESNECVDVYLITIYDKSEFENVSDKYVDQIIKGLS